MKLTESIKVGNMTLKNRVMFPPLTTGYEERDGSIGERSLAFYERLAKGGVAYIVIGDVAPVRTASPTPMLYDDRQIPTFEKLAEVCHKHGAKVSLQIFHPEYDVPGVGRLIMQSQMARKAMMEAKQAGNEEEAAKQAEIADKVTKEAYGKLHHDMQHFVSEATIEQLTAIKDAIIACSVRAEKAGIDAIEIHGDRIVGSLCSTILNHRTDEYGGVFENRVKFALEVVKGIREAAPNMVIEYKLPIITVNKDGSLRGKGGLEADEAVEFAKLLEEAGVDMIQVAQANHTGNMGDTIPPMGDVEYNWTLPVCKRVKEVVNIPVATVGRVITVEAGEKILEDGDADIIGYGRSLLTDPDIAVKAECGEPIRQCLNCNKGCVDAIQNRRYISCVLNAENGDEATIFIKPGNGVKNVAVVGGGLAGLEAARVCAKRGYKVTVFEKSDVLGGQINIASVPPRKSEILRSVQYFEKILPVLGVEIRMNCEPTLDELNTFDHVVLAIGAHSIDCPIKSVNSIVLSAWDVLNGQEVTGKVAVLGGGLVGVETAEYLAEKGHEVTIIEMAEKVAIGESGTVVPLLMKSFAKHNVTQLVNTKVEFIEDNEIQAVNVKDGSEVKISADTIVNALGSKKNSYNEKGLIVPYSVVGDCSGEKTADIASAIRSAYHAANEI